MNRLFCIITLSLILTYTSQLLAVDWSITANSIKSLAADLSSVSPPVNTPLNAEDYLDINSALGYNGPIGPYGPLGDLGPVGNNTWNSSSWISAVGNWSSWSRELNQLNGPLSPQGPLGVNGPLSPEAYDVNLPGINDFSKQLQVGGVWTVLGPVGPLGVLGPLGPLGPIGTHGYRPNEQGAYFDGNTEVRKITIDLKTYEFYEYYSEQYAMAKKDNDTSFMVDGYIAWPSAQTDAFKFTSNQNQTVTVVLTPLYALDDFDLTIRDSLGNIIATSNTYNFIDFVQLTHVPVNTELKAEVTLYSSAHTLIKRYRLMVTGSTEYISTNTPITGEHQLIRTN